MISTRAPFSCVHEGAGESRISSRAFSPLLRIRIFVGATGFAGTYTETVEDLGDLPASFIP